MTTRQQQQRLLSQPIALAVVTACVSTLAAAQQPAQPQAPPQVDRAALERQAEINKRPDTPGTGRFPAMKEEIASLPRHVVYRPRDLGALGRTKLGVGAWGGATADARTMPRAADSICSRSPRTGIWWSPAAAS